MFSATRPNGAGKSGLSDVVAVRPRHPPVPRPRAFLRLPPSSSPELSLSRGRQLGLPRVLKARPATAIPRLSSRNGTPPATMTTTTARPELHGAIPAAPATRVAPARSRAGATRATAGIAASSTSDFRRRPLRRRGRPGLRLGVVGLPAPQRRVAAGGFKLTTPACKTWTSWCGGWRPRLGLCRSRMMTS